MLVACSLIILYRPPQNYNPRSTKIVKMWWFWVSRAGAVVLGARVYIQPGSGADEYRRDISGS